jgi:hypothetical protein
MLHFAVGKIVSFDPATADGVIESPNQMRWRFGRTISDAFAVQIGDVGEFVTYGYRERNGAQQIEVIRTSRGERSIMQSAPDVGETKRVICTVGYCAPGQINRVLYAHGMADILLRPKRRVRRDLRPGDPVIAEVVRRPKGLMALRAVRLPRDWQTNGKSQKQVASDT